MDSEILDAVREWSPHPVADGYRGVHDLADERFSGAVAAGEAWAFLLNGRVVGVFDGTIEDFEDATLDAYVAPDKALPLLYAMQLRGGRTRAKYYTNETPLSEVDETLAEGGFTGYVELSENVLSGDYYVVYYGGKSMSVAFIGNSRRLISGDEAFDRANDEVGIYEVKEASVDVVDVPDPEEPASASDSEAADADEPSAAVGAVTIDEESGDDGHYGDEEAEAESAGEGARSTPDAVSADASDETADASDETADESTADAEATAVSNETADPDVRSEATRTDDGGADASPVDADESPLDTDESPLDTDESPFDTDASPADADAVQSSDSDAESSSEAAEVSDDADSPFDASADDAADAPEATTAATAAEGSTTARADADSSPPTGPDDAPESSEASAAATAVGDRDAPLAERSAHGDEAADRGDQPRRTLSPEEALAATNLFVRYETKSAGTLREIHEGETTREAVDENLVLDYHANVATEGLSVDDVPYEQFLRGSVQYEFVRWLVTDLFYEIRDTGSRRVLDRLYDAIPEIDRVEFSAAVEGTSEEYAFDVVCYDKMGNPLLVADVNDTREPTTRGMMEPLVDRATSVTETADSLAAAFSLTTSYFDPDAMEVTADATGGGLFSRTKRKSYVKISRKRGFHLCLAEARDGGFYLSVPDL